MNAPNPPEPSTIGQQSSLLREATTRLNYQFARNTAAFHADAPLNTKLDILRETERALHNLGNTLDTVAANLGLSMYESFEEVIEGTATAQEEVDFPEHDEVISVDGKGNAEYL